MTRWPYGGRAINHALGGVCELAFIGLMAWWAWVVLDDISLPTTWNPFALPIEMWPLAILLEACMVVAAGGLLVLTMLSLVRTLAAIACVIGDALSGENRQ